MKIWQAYGSEHSMNLVLIGRFKTERDAETTKTLIERVSQQAAKEDLFDSARALPENQRFSNAMRSVLESTSLFMLSPADLEQFAFDHSLEVNGERIVIRTEEADVSAFIKILIDRGAKVEVFSAHDHPESDRA